VLARRLLGRERDAVAQAMNLADDRRPAPRRAALAMLVALEQTVLFGGAPRIGLTGAPGSGKSTLLDTLVRRFRSRGETLGVVAVDPSSPRSGGALLGDRLRVRAGASDPGVFFRSMAARDHLGGLAESARAGVTILAAAFDHVLVETVGVGQSEGEVSDLVDTLVFVAQPGAGDLLQFMKAGVLERPDIFVVNKADLGAPAERTAHELGAGLAMGERSSREWTPPVVSLSARDGTGLAALDQALARHGAFLDRSGERLARRQRGRDAAVQGFLASRYGSFGLEAIGGMAVVTERLAKQARASGFALAAALGREIESSLARNH